MAWDRGQLCYGCNTTVIFMMKRTIYFLMTSNNQEVLSYRINAFNLCCWNYPFHWKLWCRQAEDGIPTFINSYFQIGHMMSCGCVLYVCLYSVKTDKLKRRALFDSSVLKSTLYTPVMTMLLMWNCVRGTIVMSLWYATSLHYKIKTSKQTNFFPVFFNFMFLE